MTRDEIASLRRHLFLALKGYFVATCDPKLCLQVEPVQVQAAGELHAACCRELQQPDRATIADCLVKSLPEVLEDLAAVTRGAEKPRDLILSAMETLEGIMEMAKEALPGSPPPAAKGGEG
jgi:hypothetical protein